MSGEDEHSGAGGQAPHVIRLRGPWNLEDGKRVKLPAVWRETLGDADAVTLSRSFNLPTGLSSSSEVCLLVKSQQTVEQVLLNGNDLAAFQDIREALQPRNLVEISLCCLDKEASILEAWLEITEI